MQGLRYFTRISTECVQFSGTFSGTSPRIGLLSKNIGHRSPVTQRLGPQTLVEDGDHSLLFTISVSYQPEVKWETVGRGATEYRMLGFATVPDE